MRIDTANSWIVTMITLGLSIAFIGCNKNQGAVPNDSGGTAPAATTNIDQQIEKIKNDPNIPADTKQRVIEGIERGKEMARTAATAPKPPGGSGPQ